MKDLCRSQQKTRYLKIASAFFIVVSIATVWLSAYKLQGIVILAGAISLYAYSVKIAYGILLNGGEKRFAILAKLPVSELLEKHAVEFSALLDLYSSVKDVSSRMPSETEDYKLKSFIEHTETINKFLVEKDEWLINQIKNKDNMSLLSS